MSDIQGGHAYLTQTDVCSAELFQAALAVLPAENTVVKSVSHSMSGVITKAFGRAAIICVKPVSDGLVFLVKSFDK